MKYRIEVSTIAPAYVLLIAALLNAVPSVGHSADPPAETDKTTINLIIEYGDGVEKRFTAIPAVKDGTVLDVMNAAQKHARGIKFEHQGKGETALLTKIDDVKNEREGRNWIYRVNGKLGDRSFAVFPVRGGDIVLWKFSEYR